jgi:ring-1,2-phenylacetyl-CoA epoxidase subunit PaaC
MYDIYNYLFLNELTKSADSQLVAFAQKSLKEVAYHLRFSSEWVVRLGDGTEESHEKVQTALDNLWRFRGEFFEMDEVDELMLKEGIGVNKAELEKSWLQMISTVIEEATLSIPENDYKATGGRKGVHSEHLGYMLAEMQYLPRAYPDAKW